MMNDQEKLWAGQFGDAYHLRNQPKNRLEFWMKVVGQLSDIQSVLEVGAGQGDNLDALRTLFPKAHFWGIDINAGACETMRNRGFTAVNCPAEFAVPGGNFDLVITRGFLIHLADDALNDALKLIYNSSRKYIVVAEYFSPDRRMVNYRGYDNAMWTDDYCEQLIKRYPKLKLKDYGFVYGDDLTWFLLEK